MEMNLCLGLEAIKNNRSQMVSHKDKYIFIHIPKTGGTSIEKALNAQQYHYDHLYYKKNVINYNNFFIFSVVRNPFERTVSDYKWATNQKYKFPAKELKKMFTGKSFRYFVDTYYNLAYKDVKYFRSQSWFKHHHLTHCRSQLDILNPICDIDYVIRFERLQQGFDFLCDKIEVPRQKLPHLNKTEVRHYTEYYDDETREIIAEKYKKDIEYFGYKFGE